MAIALFSYVFQLLNWSPFRLGARGRSAFRLGVFAFGRVWHPVLHANRLALNGFARPRAASRLSAPGSGGMRAASGRCQTGWGRGGLVQFWTRHLHRFRGNFQAWSGRGVGRHLRIVARLGFAVRQPLTSRSGAACPSGPMRLAEASGPSPRLGPPRRRNVYGGLLRAKPLVTKNFSGCAPECAPLGARGAHRRITRGAKRRVLPRTWGRGRVSDHPAPFVSHPAVGLSSSHGAAG